MRYFFDSSSIAKLYHAESGSARVISLFREPNRQVYISRLAIVELASVAAIKLRTGQITVAMHDDFNRQILVSMVLGEFVVQSLSDQDYDSAARLISTYGAKGLRTLDSLQLAASLWRQSRTGIDFFVTSDKTLAHIARQAGLDTIEP